LFLFGLSLVAGGRQPARFPEIFCITLSPLKLGKYYSFQAAFNGINRFGPDRKDSLTPIARY
jgi:hypothetical protein